LLFVSLYWIVDVKKNVKWAGFAKPAGTNTLLAYFSPDLVYIIVSVISGLHSISASGSHGWVGVLRAMLFTSFALILCAILTKRKIRLQL
jgi:heparan-alpha-glucosaminide N-acetyltransferase